MKDYITHILVPYVKKKREDLSLSPNHRALVIYDKFKAQCTQNILELLEQNGIDIVIVPTDSNHSTSASWYAQKVSQKQMKDEGTAREPVDLRLKYCKAYFIKVAT